MKRFERIVVSGVVALSTCAAVAMAQVNYAYDDGAGSNSGPNGVGLFVWGNCFDITPGGEVIDRIDVAVGRLPAGQLIDVLLYTDPTPADGPADARLVRKVTVAPASTAGNTFTSVSIPPVVLGGRFYVAAATELDGTSNVRPARIDPQTGATFGGNTWLFWGGDISQAELARASSQVQYTNLATVMVRASGRPACTGADVGSAGGAAGPDGLLDNNDFIVFIQRFFEQNPAADYAGQGASLGPDGTFDNNDLIVFIDLFFTTCP
jgi:hypothetical protein